MIRKERKGNEVEWKGREGFMLSINLNLYFEYENTSYIICLTCCLLQTQARINTGLHVFLSCNSIVTRGEVYDEILPEPEGNASPESGKVPAPNPYLAT